MAIFTRGQYAINLKDNDSYINAIARFNEGLRIDAIRDSSDNEIIIPEGKKRLKYLHEIIANLATEQDTIVIDYTAMNSSSLINAFLPFSLESKASSVNTKAAQYLKRLVEASQEEGPAFPLYDHPDRLTREDAIALAQRYDFSGAIEIPELNTILFQHGLTCFYLTYGEPCKIGDMHYMNLDIDEGFFFKDAEKSSVPTEVNQIAAKLQEHFIRWKNAGYKDELFSPQMAVKFTPSPKNDDVNPGPQICPRVLFGPEDSIPTISPSSCQKINDFVNQLITDIKGKKGRWISGAWGYKIHRLQTLSDWLTANEPTDSQNLGRALVVLNHICQEKRFLFSPQSALDFRNFLTKNEDLVHIYQRNYCELTLMGNNVENLLNQDNVSQDLINGH